jgi:hypothetical protein
MSRRTRYIALCACTLVSFMTLGKAPRLVEVGAREMRSAERIEVAGRG